MSLATHLSKLLNPKKSNLAVGKLVSGLPKSSVLEFVHAPDADIYAVTLPGELVAKSELPGLKVVGLTRYLALDLATPLGMRPRVGMAKRGKADFSSVVEGQFLLAETGGGGKVKPRYTLVLPLVEGDVRATLRGTKSSWTLKWEGGGKTEAELLLIAEGHEPYSLVRQVMAVARERLGTFRLAEEKHDVIPPGLGWCTADAFGTEVSEAKVMAGLKSFREAGVPLTWCVLDDGWMDTDGAPARLRDFPADRKKFPHGLKKLIEHAKGEGYVHHFGVRHAFQGSEAGIKRGSPLDKRYKTVTPRGATPDLRTVHPHDAHRFYNDLHQYLRDQGVDLITVDGQSATDEFTPPTTTTATPRVTPRVAAMRTLQYALQSSALLHFEGRMIHGGAHSSDLAFHMLGTSLICNSDDFTPTRPESHGRHVSDNALNAVWTHTFGVPDWDRFGSGQPDAGFHAAARALSGGPVYVSDEPGTQDAALLWSLLDDTGMVLKVDRAGLPAVRSLFVDAPAGEDALVLTNTAGEGHLLLGAFNCSTTDRISTVVEPEDVPEYDGEAVVAYSFRTGGAAVVRGRGNGIGMLLDPLEYDVITFAPLLSPGVAFLGIRGKLIGAAALRCSTVKDKTTTHFHLTTGGTALFYSEKKPKDIDLQGLLHHRPTPGELSYDRKTKLLTVEIPRGGEVCVCIRV